MIKRLIVFGIAIAAILFFALKDDAGTSKETVKETEQKEEGISSQEEAKEEGVHSESEVILSQEEKSEETVSEKEVKETSQEPKKETFIVPAVKTTTSTQGKQETTKKAKVYTHAKSKPVVIAQPVKKEAIAGPTTNVKVYLYEWNVDVSQAEVPAGTIHFEVVNNGNFSHSFGIEGKKEFGRVNPGETRMFTTQLEKGEFNLFSSKSVDVERGMAEMFTVR